MVKLLIVLSFVMSVCSCKTRNCDGIPDEFHSYEEAIDVIKSKSFNVEDSVIVDNGSFMLSASYYSCDGKVGYFFYKRKSGMEYFVSDVPITVWQEFRKSDNREDYYNKNIDDKYTSVAIIINV